jgi:hypothetical protein
LQTLLGEQVQGLSPNVIVRLKEHWAAEYEEWNRRQLTGKQYVYLWADGIYVNVRLEDTENKRQCLLVVLGATAEGYKELVAVRDGYRESEQSWHELLIDLKQRGLTWAPQLATGDGALGFWAALRKVFPETREQRCWVHKTKLSATSRTATLCSVPWDRSRGREGIRSHPGCRSRPCPSVAAAILVLAEVLRANSQDSFDSSGRGRYSFGRPAGLDWCKPKQSLGLHRFVFSFGFAGFVRIPSDSFDRGMCVYRPNEFRHRATQPRGANAGPLRGQQKADAETRTNFAILSGAGRHLPVLRIPKRCSWAGAGRLLSRPEPSKGVASVQALFPFGLRRLRTMLVGMKTTLAPAAAATGFLLVALVTGCGPAIPTRSTDKATPLAGPAVTTTSLAEESRAVKAAHPARPEPAAPRATAGDNGPTAAQLPDKPQPREPLAQAENPPDASQADAAPPPDKPLPDDPPNPSAKKLGKNVFFETLPGGQRRVYVSATVCLREGSFGLECFLCRRGTKEHESVVATEADARVIHAALKVAGIEPGKPVEFDPQFKPPTGDRVKVSVQYHDPQGKIVTLRAQDWVQDVKTKKALGDDWVFAGSLLVPAFDPKDPPVYAASQDGALICVTNVPTAMLDLPIASPKQLENRSFAPYTERIPPLETRVFVLLEAFPKKKN